MNIPIMHAERKYDPEQRRKVLKKEDNPDFVAQVSSERSAEQRLNSARVS